MSCCTGTKSHTTGCSKPEYDIGDIFRDNLDKLRGKISREHWKVVNAITACRTERLGGHKLQCTHCQHTEQSYNSCRNRHCPKCQAAARLLWVNKRMTELLPIKYFHVVFALPDIMHDLALCNKGKLYDMLFKVVRETLTEAAANPKNLGARIGIISVLHTWGQKLNFHPHMHCVVTGGGLSADGTRWIPCKKNFFISVKILSALFRGKFLDYLQKTYAGGGLMFYGKAEKLKQPDQFKKLIDAAYKKTWITYCKKPFSKPGHVLKYLGRYTHRIAISNHRILKVTPETVSFRWKDYRDESKIKTLTLKVAEFMRRFLLHVLPYGFIKVRFSGILCNRRKKENLEKCRQILGVAKTEENEEKEPETWQELFQNLTGIDISLCPKCKTGRMEIIAPIPEKLPGYKGGRIARMFDSS